MPEEAELWKQFCEQASKEQDPAKLLKLIEQIEAQLDAKDRLSDQNRKKVETQ
jgi:hypothetical protein